MAEKHRGMRIHHQFALENWCVNKGLEPGAYRRAVLFSDPQAVESILQLLIDELDTRGALEAEGHTHVSTGRDRLTNSDINRAIYFMATMLQLEDLPITGKLLELLRRQLHIKETPTPLHHTENFSVAVILRRANPDMSVGAIGRYLGISKGSASKIVNSEAFNPALEKSISTPAQARELLEHFYPDRSLE